MPRVNRALEKMGAKTLTDTVLLDLNRNCEFIRAYSKQLPACPRLLSEASGGL